MPFLSIGLSIQAGIEPTGKSPFRAELHYVNQRHGTKCLLVHCSPNVLKQAMGAGFPHTLPSGGPSVPCGGGPLRVQWMPLGLFPLGQQRSRKVKATYEVDHDKVVMGIATAATARAIRVQAALERRFSLWGIWRIHLVQDKAEEGAGSVHWGQVTVTMEGSVREKGWLQIPKPQAGLMVWEQ